MKLDLSHKGLTTLEGIDLTGVTELYCYSNELTSLGVKTLPSTLKTLHCGNNRLTFLPELPSTLEKLSCWQNQLTLLPQLPPTLIHLDCSNNKLTSLCTKFPPNLKFLFCISNQLTYLPELPSTLEEFDCEDSKLLNIPDLPYSIKAFWSNDNESYTSHSLVTLKLQQHNEKRKKLGLQDVDRLPKKKEWDDINKLYTISRYEPGGDMFEQSMNAITNLLS